MTIKIHKKDLRQVYEDHQTADREGYKLEALLKNLEVCTNPLALREDICSIGQLYVDGIIGNDVQRIIRSIYASPESLEEWKEQKKILDAINLAGITAMGQFYSGEGINARQVRGIILPYASEIIKYGSSSLAKLRHMTPQIDRMQKFGQFLQKYPNAIVNIDSIVAVASGGLEPAYLVANAYGINDIAVPRYSSIGKRDSSVKLPKNAPQGYMENYSAGKDVAVVEDTVCLGESMREVIGKVLECSPKRVVGMFVEDAAGGKGCSLVLRRFPEMAREQINASYEPGFFEIRGKK